MTQANLTQAAGLEVGVRDAADIAPVAVASLADLLLAACLGEHQGTACS